ncbi:MAG: CHAT domain-containing protein [Bacteroidetes bacterium]|nr:CHAT domain-containing protein [Bacteroidota bacterium]
MATLNGLIKNLTQQYDDGPITAVRLVKGYDNSYALNAEGQITALSMGNSQLKKLVLGKEAEALEYFYLSGSESLEEVVFEVPLPQLTHLYLNNCAIERITFPAGFRSLQQIYLQKNGLQRLVFEGDCPELLLLDASDNCLEEFYLPFPFEKLSYLYLLGQDNHPRNIPSEVIGQGPNCSDRVKAFFRASLQSGDILNHEAKCIFFGNGRAGKTTLSHQLRKNEFDPTIQYTHGILIEEWEILEQDFSEELKEKIAKEQTSYQERRNRTLPDLSKIQLNVWDFGGQEYFHATHRLFLNNNVLYLLVWEQSTNQQNEETGDYPASYWQANINHYAPQNTTLTVQNKEKGRAAINHAQGCYKVALRVDSKPRPYELDIEVLKEAIIQQLPHLSYLAVPIPKLYDDIRQELRALKSSQPYLLFNDYKNLCQRIDKTADKIMQNESDLKALTTFLHETGCIICYRYDDKKKNDTLHDYVFINPQWVTETIYHILDEGTLVQNGEFDRLHVANVLEVKQNVIRDSAVWLELMTQFELIFQKKNEENQFITPQYLPKKCHDLSEKAWNNLIEDLPYQLVLHYPDFLPKSVISRFICRYGNLAKDYYWKYGIVFHSGGEEAYVHCDYDKKSITVHTKTLISPLANEIFETLRAIDATDSLEIAVSEDKTPSQLTGFVNFKKLRERVEKGKTDVEWNGDEFATSHFMKLLNREAISPAVVKSKEERDLGKENETPNKTMIDNSKPYPVPMAEDDRTFVPFSEVEGKVKVLFIAANPTDASRLKTDVEYRKIRDEMNRGRHRDKFDFLPPQLAVTIQELVRAMNDKPHIVHFSGHGEEEGILITTGENVSQLLPTPAIKRLFKPLQGSAQVVLLNACYSATQAEEISKFGFYVVGHQESIGDDAAIGFAQGLYNGLGEGKSFEEAYNDAMVVLLTIASDYGDVVAVWKDGQKLAL